MAATDRMDRNAHFVESGSPDRIAVGIQKIMTPVLSWNGLIDESTPDQLQAQLVEVLNRVRYRRAMYL